MSADMAFNTGVQLERERIVALIEQMEDVTFIADADQDYIVGDALDLIELIKMGTK